VAGGTPTYWLEHHSLNYQAYATHVASIVYSGVLEQMPGLCFVLEEGGIGWMPSLLWRLDRAWRELGSSIPHLQRRPSEIVRERFWFTTQPLDEPESDAQLLELLGQLDMDDRIMFSSDYPHHDFDAPGRVLGPSIPFELREKFFWRNAEALFGFEGRR
jgi:predicted TIM-barrel fold metal-dependent hydrolase